MQFSRIIGHAGLKAKLIGNIRERRIAHAQLFVGPRGSGNLPMALAYARYLLCEQKEEADSCGRCSSCMQMEKLEHPDLHLAFPIYLLEKVRTCDHFVQDWRKAVIEQPYLDLDMWRQTLESENKQLRMGVDVAHEIQKRLSLRSFRGGHKVMLIWQPELMDTAASNKLLKVLEEPEPATVFLLVCNDAEQLLATIMSRAQLLKVPAIPPMALAETLRERYPELTKEMSEMIGLRSEGDLLESFEMAEKGEEELFVFFRDWLRTCYARSVVETGDFADQFQKMGRERQKSLLRYGLQMIRQCVLEWQQVPELVRSIGQENEFVQKFSKLVHHGNADGIREEFEKAHVHIERNANPKILFMDMSYRIMGLLKSKAPV
jgi:DNA polymerase III subunit delta'